MYLSFFKNMPTFIILLVFAQQTWSVYAKAEVKPNILFIIVDDLRHLSVENVYLPNIEKLNARGVSFKHAYAQVSVALVIFIVFSIIICSR